MKEKENKTNKEKTPTKTIGKEEVEGRVKPKTRVQRREKPAKETEEKLNVVVDVNRVAVFG